MIGRENEKLENVDNRTREKLLAKRLLTKIILGFVVTLGIVVVLLIISNNTQASVDLTPDYQSYTGEPGDTINFVITISNEGNAQDIFYLTLQGTYTDWGQILDYTGQLITHVTLNASYQPGSFVNIILRVEIPGASETTAGHHYPILLKAASITLEGVEDIVQVSITVEEYVDLLLEYSGSGTPKKDYDPNKKSPEFTFRLTNNGNKIESGIEVRVDPEDWAYVPGTIVEEVEPGGTATFSLEFTIPDEETEGEYDLQVYLVSSVDTTKESDPVLITINITKPDLTINDVFIPNEETLKSRVGDHVTISATVSNEGHTIAESIQVKLYMDGILKDTLTISSIEPGGSRDANFRWKVVADDVELEVEVTPIEEIDDGNNAISPIYLELRPNLHFEGEQLNFSNQNPEPGEKITIRALIKNTGGDAKGVVVIFTYGTRTIGTDTLDIDYREIGEAIFEDWTVPDKAGESLNMKAKIDLEDAIGDGEEAARYIKVAEKDEMIFSEVFSGNLIGIVLGFISGAIIFFIVGFLIGTRDRKSQESKRQETEGVSNFVEFETMMEEPPEMEKKEKPYNLPPPPPPPPPELQEKSSPPSFPSLTPPQEGTSDFQTTEKEILGKEDHLESNIGD